MGTTLHKMIKRLPPKRRARIKKQARELIAQELTLRDLRKALALTQERMAKILDIGQDSVSRLEKRGDLLLSTLRSYLAAMGGSLKLTAEFPNRPPVTLAGLSELGELGEKEPNRNRSV